MKPLKILHSTFQIAILLFFSLQLASPFIHLNYWPWSNYHMYSYILDDSTTYSISFKFHNEFNQEIKLEKMEQERLSFLAHELPAHKYEALLKKKINIVYYKQYNKNLYAAPIKKRCKDSWPIKCLPGKIAYDKIKLF